MVRAWVALEMVFFVANLSCVPFLSRSHRLYGH